jgi:methane/ammonia monooxygenase subunit B
MDGVKIDNLETYALGDVLKWHSLLAALGLFWLLWWVWRPLLIPRYQALKQGREDLLITPLDLTVGVILGVFLFVLIITEYNRASNKYPKRVPLQTSRMYTDPIEVADPKIKINVTRAEYDVPGRSMRMWMEIKNNNEESIRLGELTTANLRFINRDFKNAMNNVDEGYPSEHLADTGLNIDDDGFIAPGRTKKLFVSATDARWETERLTAFLTDVDARIGALLFFYNNNGDRKIVDVASSILPVFTVADEEGASPDYQRIGR